VIRGCRAINVVKCRGGHPAPPFVLSPGSHATMAAGRFRFLDHRRPAQRLAGKPRLWSSPPAVIPQAAHDARTVHQEDYHHEG